jgi:hypothetical protein
MLSLPLAVYLRGTFAFQTDAILGLELAAYVVGNWMLAMMLGCWKNGGVKISKKLEDGGERLEKEVE